MLDTTTLQQGDLIFTSIPHLVYQKLEQATHSPASHVGILLQDDVCGWLVAESKVPHSTYTPITNFIRRSKNGWISVRRSKTPLSDADITRLRKACDERIGISYHMGFNYASKKQFCSKFVFDIYKESFGRTIGALETFEHLLSKNPNLNLSFWHVWFLCKIPWARITVTPASLYFDTNLDTIFEGRAY